MKSLIVMIMIMTSGVALAGEEPFYTTKNGATELTDCQKFSRCVCGVDDLLLFAGKPALFAQECANTKQLLLKQPNDPSCGPGLDFIKGLLGSVLSSQGLDADKQPPSCR